MPNFQITSASGYSWSCASSNPELIAQWLMETIVREFPDAHTAYHSPVTIRVYPMAIPDGSVDWPARTGSWTVLYPEGGRPGADHVRKVIDWLQREVDRGEKI